MKLAPILLFAYNRPRHLRMIIAALQKNYLASASTLHIFCDGPKNEVDVLKCAEVQKVTKRITGFKNISVYTQENNIGLAESVIYGVTKILDHNSSVIVLEDDIVTHPYFLTYMNTALQFYKNSTHIFSISGYNHPTNLLRIPDNYTKDIFLSRRPSSWGWATWKDRWEKIEWDTQKIIRNLKSMNKLDAAGEDLRAMLILQSKGKIDSWAVRFCASSVQHNGFCVYPTISLVDNIGMDGTGRHSDPTSKYKNKLSHTVTTIKFEKNLQINKQLDSNFLSIYKTPILYKFFDLIKVLLRMQ